MNKKFQLDALQPADRLVLPKSGVGFIQHHAIYIGKNKKGSRLYIENAIGEGVRVVDEAYLFRDSYKLTRVEPFAGNRNQRKTAVRLARQLIGREYDLLNFNCEHYANTVQRNKRYSTQVENGIVLGLLAIVLYIGLSK